MGAGLPGGRRVRPAARRGLRPDRPGATRPGTPTSPPRGSTRSRRSSEARGQDRHVRLAADTPGNPRRRRRFGRALVERGDPGRAGRDPRPHPLASATSRVDAARRVLSSTASRRARRSIELPAGEARQEVRLHDIAPARGRRGPPRQGRLSGTPDPFERRRSAVLHLQGPPALKVLLDLRPSRTTPSSSRPRSTPDPSRQPP